MPFVMLRVSGRGQHHQEFSVSAHLNTISPYIGVWRGVARARLAEGQGPRDGPEHMSRCGTRRGRPHAENIDGFGTIKFHDKRQLIILVWGRYLVHLHVPTRAVGEGL